FLRHLFDCCSTVVRLLFDSASTLLRLCFDSCSSPVRLLFDSSSTPLRVSSATSRRTPEALPKKRLPCFELICNFHPILPKYQPFAGLKTLHLNRIFSFR